MNGFRILYSLPDGTRDTTFFEAPAYAGASLVSRSPS